MKKFNDSHRNKTDQEIQRGIKEEIKKSGIRNLSDRKLKINEHEIKMIAWKLKIGASLYKIVKENKNKSIEEITVYGEKLLKEIVNKNNFGAHNLSEIAKHPAQSDLHGWNTIERIKKYFNYKWDHKAELAMLNFADILWNDDFQSGKNNNHHLSALSKYFSGNDEERKNYLRFDWWIDRISRMYSNEFVAKGNAPSNIEARTSEPFYNELNPKA